MLSQRWHFAVRRAYRGMAREPKHAGDGMNNLANLEAKIIFSCVSPQPFQLFPNWVTVIESKSSFSNPDLLLHSSIHLNL